MYTKTFSMVLALAFGLLFPSTTGCAAEGADDNDDDAPAAAEEETAETTAELRSSIAPACVVGGRSFIKDNPATVGGFLYSRCPRPIRAKAIIAFAPDSPCYSFGAYANGKWVAHGPLRVDFRLPRVGRFDRIVLC